MLNRNSQYQHINTNLTPPLSTAIELQKKHNIRIGDIELSSNVILAPMSGVTDLPFRKLVKKFGVEQGSHVGLVVSEMVASRAMIASSRQSLQKSAIIDDDATGACVQLAGCEAEVIAEAG